MAANCNYKVKLIGALDMLRFKNMPKVREAAIQAAPATPLPKTFTTNEKAKVRHPEMQRVVVAEIRPNGPDVKTIVLKSEDGAPLAPFRAGQYVSVTAHIGETVTTRAYSLSGSPAWAKRGEYNIAVRRDPNGFVSPWVQDTWQVGQKLTISGPQGQLYYERLRDAKKVVALAGGVGITPFMAMARAPRRASSIKRNWRRSPRRAIRCTSSTFSPTRKRKATSTASSPRSSSKNTAARSTASSCAARRGCTITLIPRSSRSACAASMCAASFSARSKIRGISRIIPPVFEAKRLK